MLRTLSRLAGFLILAGGFVGAVFDGARSIANNALRLTSIGDLAAALFRDRYAGLQGAAESAQGIAWHYLGAPLVAAPVALVAIVLGALLLWLGQPPRDPLASYARR